MYHEQMELIPEGKVGLTFKNQCNSPDWVYQLARALSQCSKVGDFIAIKAHARINQSLSGTTNHSLSLSLPTFPSSSKNQ